MAERSAMASGFSLSEIATEGGCGLNVATGGGAGRGCGAVRSTGASWAMEALGVMGDTGGRFGDADSERLRERPDDDDASLDEAGRACASVSTRSAGMAAERARLQRGWSQSQITDRRVTGRLRKLGVNYRYPACTDAAQGRNRSRSPAWWRRSGGGCSRVHARSEIRCVGRRGAVIAACTPCACPRQSTKYCVESLRGGKGIGFRGCCGLGRPSE